MSNGAEAAAAIARAVKASSVLMRLEPEEFLKVLNRMEAPLVVVSMGSFFSCYLGSDRLKLLINKEMGLIFAPK